MIVFLDDLAKPREWYWPLAVRIIDAALIAVWGKVQLEPLDPKSLSILASGGSIQEGFLFDFLSNFQDSARQGLQVYRLLGGAGYVWSARRDANGRGHLRFSAIDASALGAPKPLPAPQTLPAPPKPLPAPQTQPAPPEPPTEPSISASSQAWKNCQSDDPDSQLNGCTLVIDAGGFGSRSRLAGALEGRCRAFIKRKQYDRAIIDCRASIGNNPRYSYAYAHLGEAFLALNDYPNAIDALNKAIELKSNSIWSRLSRAAAFDLSAKTQLALSDYQYALFIDPSNQRARAGVNSLTKEPVGLGADQDIVACYQSVSRANRDNQTSTMNVNERSHRIRALEGTIALLETDASKLAQFADEKSEEASARKRQQERRLGELVGTRQATLPDDLQKVAAVYWDAQQRADESENELARHRTILKAAQEGRGQRETKRVEELRKRINQLELEDANFDRDAQQKRERLGELKEKTDKAAFEFATAFAQLDREITDSDRQARCASEARREAQLLTDKARQLRGTLEEQRVLVERETSETLVSDLAEFSKGIDALVPIETAALVVDLKSASNSDNHERIAQARAKLETKLRELSGFGEFRRDAEQKRLQLAQAELASAVTRARLVIDFVGEYISRNLGSDKVQPLLAINRDITGALGYENAATLTDVIAAKEVELTSLGLAQEYKTFASRPDPAQPSGAHITEEAIEFLNDTQRFIGTQPAIDRIGDIALEAAGLRKAIDGADPAAAQKAMARLKGMLDPVEGFSDFLQRRLEERRRELARRLAVTTAKLK